MAGGCVRRSDFEHASGGLLANGPRLSEVLFPVDNGTNNSQELCVCHRLHIGFLEAGRFLSSELLHAALAASRFFYRWR